jgi:catechol 2,3-dioxygenase-like lactoylglutathione lyase family enzyme
MGPRFWHVGLTVSDLDKSARFYRDIVGMAEGARMPSANPQFAALVNLPGATLISVFLTLDGFTLQLLQYLTQAGKTLVPGHNHIGSPHLSFFVPDAAEKHRSLTSQRHVRITSPVITNASGTIRSFYISDPDGVPIEFVEPLAAAPPAGRN